MLKISGLFLVLFMSSSCSHQPIPVLGSKLVRSANGEASQLIDVANFSDAEFDRFGFYDGGGTYEHAYGGEKYGYFAYEFSKLEKSPKSLTVSARLSAESGEKGKPHETSDVTLVINGIFVGTQTVAADDQKGSVYSWTITDSGLLASLAEGQNSANSLRFEVKKEAKNQHGLCIYGSSIEPDGDGRPIVLDVSAAPQNL